MPGRHWTWTLLAVLLYSTAIALAGSVLVSDPTSPLVVLPVLAGAILLVHALVTARLDELGYAIVGMWAAVLALSVGTGVAETVGFDSRIPAPSIEVPVARVAGTLGPTAVLIVVYWLLVAGVRIEDAVPTRSR